MTPDHRYYLQEAYESFVAAAIQRIALTGQGVYRYTISASSIKEAGGLTRLKSSVIQEYIDYFAMLGVLARYNEAFETLDITLNLNSCSLSPHQSEALANAMATFRVANM